MPIPYDKKTPHRFDVVGSFLRPDALKRARADFEAGRIGAAELKAVEDEAIRDLVALRPGTSTSCGGLTAWTTSPPSAGSPSTTSRP